MLCNPGQGGVGNVEALGFDAQANNGFDFIRTIEVSRNDKKASEEIWRYAMCSGNVACAADDGVPTV